jgi:yecA family protein
MQSLIHKMSETLEYEALAERLARAGAETSVADAHGMLCGMLCGAPGEIDTPAWVQEIFDRSPDQADLLMREALTQLAWLLKQTREQLVDPELGFQPLLPADDQSLLRRIEALGDWCRGFLTGFGLSGGTEKDTLPEDVNELLSDFAEITKVSAEPGDEEADEASLAEITEYVRVGVLLVYEELHPTQTAPAPSPTKH